MQVPQTAMASYVPRTPVSPTLKGQIEHIKDMGMGDKSGEDVKAACHTFLQKPDAKKESAIIALLEVAIELQSKGKLVAAEGIYCRIDQATGNMEAHQRYESVMLIRRLGDSSESIMPMLQKMADQDDRPMAAFFYAQTLIGNEKRTHLDVESAIGYFEKALREGHPSAKEDLRNAREESGSPSGVARATSANTVHPAENLD